VDFGGRGWPASELGGRVRDERERERERERGDAYCAVVDGVDAAASITERESEIFVAEKRVAARVCAVL
jgi:HD superfamily phosphodiesterase